MRVLAVSVAPLFPEFVMGGSQRVLMDVVAGLGEAGHEVRVLCTQLSENTGGFSPAPSVMVEPTLRLKGTFPAPYETAPHLLAETWRVLRDAAAWADRIYLHADAIYMRTALGNRPIARSLHDFVYEEALVSAFTLPADLTIVPSGYLKQCIEASAGRVADVGEIRVIPNGVQAPTAPVTPQPPTGVRPRQFGDIVLLHPHRPQPRKGTRESLLIAAELQRRLPDQRVRLLVPAYPSGSALDEATDAAERVRVIAADVGAENLLEMHEWLSPDAMPGYYAFGDVTLCPGNFIEAFGLVPVESVATGTPAVCARVGAFRELEGLPGLKHTAHGNIQAAVDAVAELVTHKPDMKHAARAVADRFSYSRMVAGYVEAITGPLPQGRKGRATPGNFLVGAPLAAPRGSLEATHIVDESYQTPKHWQLAPWCYVEGERIYHDYLYAFISFPRVTAALTQNQGYIQLPQSDDSALAEEFTHAVRDGFLIPG